MAVSTIVGTVIGGGVFAIPYAFSVAGFFLGTAYLFLFAFILMVLYLLYGEIILRTHQNMRFYGYAGLYLGQWAKALVVVSTVIGLFGSMVAYIVLGGAFAKNLFNVYLDIKFDSHVILFWAVFSLFFLFGIKTFAKSEFWMSLGLVLLIFIIFFIGLPHLKAANLDVITFNSPFFPYGIILFALSGAVAIPEARDLLKGKEKILNKIIIIGAIIPALLYFIFSLTVVGITGKNTTKEAMEGLQFLLGNKIIILGSIFGLLAIATSYLTIGTYLKDLLFYDIGLNKISAVFLVAIFPIAAYLLGFINYIVIISFIGAVMGGLDAVLTILIFRSARKNGKRSPEYVTKFPVAVLYTIMLVFIIGIVLEIILKV